MECCPNYVRIVYSLTIDLQLACSVERDFSFIMSPIRRLSEWAAQPYTDNWEFLSWISFRAFTIAAALSVTIARNLVEPISFITSCIMFWIYSLVCRSVSVERVLYSTGSGVETTKFTMDSLRMLLQPSHWRHNATALAIFVWTETSTRSYSFWSKVFEMLCRVGRVYPGLSFFKNCFQ